MKTLKFGLPPADGFSEKVEKQLDEGVKPLEKVSISEQIKKGGIL